MDASPLLDLQPTLSGKLVVLRPLHESDWTDLYAVAADPLIWDQHPEPERCQAAVFRRFFDSGLAGGGALVVLDAATGSVIGSSRFHGLDAGRSEVEIGWTFLARSHWGGRCNGEMKQLMMAHALRSVESVFFAVAPGNLRSQRAMTKIGVGCEGLQFLRDRDYLIYRASRAWLGSAGSLTTNRDA